MSITSRLAAAPDARRRSVIAMLLVVAGLVSFASVTFSITDPQLAAWWPAAGFAAVAGMLARGRERWLVFALVIVATGGGNLLTGRDPLVALLLGVGNAVEVVIIAALLAPGGRPLPVAALRQVGRVIGVVLVAAAATGVVLAVVAWVFLQRNPLEGFVQLTASHASALLVMLPVALVPLPTGRGVRGIEIAAQSLALGALIALIFWPGNTWPGVFVPLFVLLWSAMRFPIFVTTIQALATATAVIVMTSLGGGPFSAFAFEGRLLVVIMQAFVVAFAIAVLLVAAARLDWLSVVNRLLA